MDDDIPQLLDSVAVRLCERRALKPLWRFLGAYFALNGLTDGWHDCYEALRDVRALCGSDLQPDELRDINFLINRIGQMLEKHDFLEELKGDIADAFPVTDPNGYSNLTKGELSGMNINERLSAFDLFPQWDQASMKRDRRTMIQILQKVDLTEDEAVQTVETILNNPAKYGF